MNDAFCAGGPETDDVTVGFTLYDASFLSARSRNNSSVDSVNEYWPTTGDLARRCGGGLKHLVTERATHFKSDVVVLSAVREFAFVQIPQAHAGSCRPMSNSKRLNFPHESNQRVDLEITVGKDFATRDVGLLSLNLVGSDASEIKREFHLL